MDSNVTKPSDTEKSASVVDNASPSSKGKAKADEKDHDMEEVEEGEEEEEEYEDEGSEEETTEDEEDYKEIDPNVIMPQGRRTRGVRVDYTSKEALAKAGLQEHEGEESDDDVEMKD